MRRHILIGSIGSLFVLSVGCFKDAPANDAAVADIGATDRPSADVGTPDAGVVDAGPLDARPTDVAGDLGVTSDLAATDAADGGGACTPTRALVTTTDFMSGGYALGPIGPTPSLTVSGAMSPDQDHVPVASGCVVYNLLRSSDVLAVLDNANLPTVARRIPLRMMGTPGVDAGAPGPYAANPYDVLTLSPTRALVVQYALPRLGIIDPTRDGAAGAMGVVDLTPLLASADMDGSPEASNIVRVGGSIFVSLQNLNRFTPVTNGSLAVINATDLTLVDVEPATAGVQGVQLSGRNPVSMVLTPGGGSIVIAEAGVVAFSAPQSLDGRIERVDPATLRVQGMSVSETALGGDLGSIVMLDETRGWAVVSRLAVADASVADSRVVEFDLATGMVGRTIVTAGNIVGLARDPIGNVWVLNRTTGSAGVRVFRPDGGTVTTMTISTGAQAPYGVAFVP